MISGGPRRKCGQPGDSPGDSFSNSRISSKITLFLTPFTPRPDWENDGQIWAILIRDYGLNGPVEMADEMPVISGSFVRKCGPSFDSPEDSASDSNRG